MRSAVAAQCPPSAHEVTHLMASGDATPIATLLAPATTQSGFDLVRVCFTGTGTRTLQVMAERPDGAMSLEDCTALSRTLSALLDNADPVPGRYTLEVSSPGMDRPLTRREDFHRWNDHPVRIEWTRPDGARKRVSGLLRTLSPSNGAPSNGEIIAVETADGETVRMPFESITRARLVMPAGKISASGAAA